MDQELNRTSLMYGVPGIVIQLAASFVPAMMGADLDKPTTGSTVAYYGCLVAGTALLMVGLSYYAAAKGHSRWAGLLGLLSILGLIVLALLPDKRK